MAANNVKFEEILGLAGEMGRWQVVVFLWTFVGAVLTAAHNISSIFLAAVPEHHCSWPEGEDPEDWLPINNATGNFSQCSILESPGSNVTVPCSSYVFIMEEDSSTIVSDWDLVCSRRWLASTAQASYMFGIFCGALISGVFSDQFGRKTAVVASGVGFLVSAVAASFATSYALFVTLRFITAMSGAGVFGCLFILYMEIIGPQWRALMGLLYQVPFAMGFMLLPLVAYLNRHWQHLQLAISVPAALMLAFWWVMPESPRWLAMQGRLDEALAVIKFGAARNRRQLPSDQRMLKMLAEFRASETGADGVDVPPRSVLSSCLAGVCEISGLLRTPKMRRITLATFYNWMVVSMVYYGVSFNSASLSSSPYLAIFLAGLVEAPAVVLSVPLINRLGRRPIIIGTHIITGVSILCILAVPADLSWPKLLLATVGKFSSSATFGIIYLYSAEYFPTQLRNAGFGASSTCARVGSMSAPYIVDLLSVVHWAIPSCVFGMCAVTAALTALCLPETVGRRMPETVEEIESGSWLLAEPALQADRWNDAETEKLG